MEHLAMRIIQNLLILLVLMVGLLFAARQVGAGMGKGDVLAYVACRGQFKPCISKLLDTRTMMDVRFGLQNIANMFWTENGDLYMTVGAMGKEILYQWNGGGLHYLGSLSPNTYLKHNENNQFAFYLNIDNTWQLIIWDGAQLIEFIPPFGDNMDPIWAADGRFAFVSNNTVYISDGVTTTSLGQAQYGGLDWSVNGHLVFVSERDGNDEIYVWDGTTLTNISQHAALDYNSVWGPDGRLAFISKRDGNTEIYVWDGEALTNASQTPELDYSPTWSKDGRLAFFTEGKNVSIWGKEGLHRIELEDKSFQLYSWQWLSHGRLLFFGDTRSYIWDQGVTVKFLPDSIIEYGDSGVAFISTQYRTDSLYELYVLDGQNIVGTGLIGSVLEFEPDGRGGLLGKVCGVIPRSCDLYHWKDGQVHRLTNTPDISEHGPSFRP
jgi:WD40-like Beta Propeller Repeat